MSRYAMPIWTCSQVQVPCHTCTGTRMRVSHACVCAYARPNRILGATQVGVVGDGARVPFINNALASALMPCRPVPSLACFRRARARQSGCRAEAEPESKPDARQQKVASRHAGPRPSARARDHAKQPDACRPILAGGARSSRSSS